MGIATQTSQAAYIAALHQADWFYQFADDSRAYKRGYGKMAQLRQMQKECDPSGALWNSVAPVQKHGCPKPIDYTAEAAQ